MVIRGFRARCSDRGRTPNETLARSFSMAGVTKPREQGRNLMRFTVRAAPLICIAMLGGCSEGVLDPRGPIASAQRLILFNATGIMLAIVIPTMLATLAFAFWFRSSNSRAIYLPEFHYSGRLELLVWSIPIM